MRQRRLRRVQVVCSDDCHSPLLVQLITSGGELARATAQPIMRSHLEAVSTLLERADTEAALRMLRNTWEPDLPGEERVPTYSMWIRCLCELGDLDHALILAKRAAREFPRDSDILTALGNVHDLRDELPQAHEAFELAVELEGGIPVQHYNLGTVLERLGRESEAEREFRTALEIEDGSPPMPEATAALGAMWRRRGQLERACDLYERHLEEDPLDIEILLEQGICLSDLDRYEEATERYSSAVSMAPDHPGAWYNFGVTLFRMGKLDEARHAMQHALELEPDNSLTAAVLGSWLLAAGDNHVEKGIGLTYRACERTLDMVDRGDMDLYYASLVIEEVFEGLWSSGRKREGRDIAYRAGRRDVVTSHILDTLNRADRGPALGAQTFVVAARARMLPQAELPLHEAKRSPAAHIRRDEAHDAKTLAPVESVVQGQVQVLTQPAESPPVRSPKLVQRHRPEQWPEGSDGYTTQLTVVAENEDQARALTIEYLARLEPETRLHFQLSVDCRTDADGDGVDPSQAARGVVRIHGLRDYFPAEPQESDPTFANSYEGSRESVATPESLLESDRQPA